jgi:hypothetical protein
MITGSIPVLSPQAHRRIDQFAFPALLTTAALMSRRDPTAASIALMTAAVEGTAHLITDYPPAILPWISFRDHNRWAFAHGLLVAALALSLPGIARRNRWALGALAAMPIALAAVSDTRQG